MAGNSQNCSNFATEPMGDKAVTELAGIGKTLGRRLIDAGYDKAYALLGQYLILKKDEELFKIWLRKVCNASPKQASECYNCLDEWCEEFL